MRDSYMHWLRPIVISLAVISAVVFISFLFDDEMGDSSCGGG